MFEPLTSGIVIAKVAVAAKVAIAKATTASAAYATTVVAVNAAITGAIAGGSTAGLVTYLSTPGGKKALKRVITRLSLYDWAKLVENIAKSARVASAFSQDKDGVISEVGRTAELLQQGILTFVPGFGP